MCADSNFRIEGNVQVSLQVICSPFVQPLSQTCFLPSMEVILRTASILPTNYDFPS